MDEDYRDLEPAREIDRLLEIMKRLRDPLSGCPWDQKQTFKSIAPYTVEEAYEVKDAVERDDMVDLCDELGDLLLQVVYHADIASDRGDFDFGDVVQSITAKMLRRHPHVFGNEEQRKNGMQPGQWERIKKLERAQKVTSKGAAGAQTEQFLLDTIPNNLPALSRALKLQNRASTVGFDWNDINLVFDKLREEFAEFEVEYASGNLEKMSEEMGDILFVAVNLARHLKIDAEAALSGTNEKFIKRFSYIEQTLIDRDQTLEGTDLEVMESLWIKSKNFDI